MPHSVQRLRYLAAALVVALLAAVLSVAVPIKAHAATVAYKILDAHALSTAPVNTIWATQITEVNNTSGSFILSSNPDGTGDTLVRDELAVYLDGSLSDGFGAGYEGLGCTPSTLQPPPTFPEGVLSLGIHTLRATARNKCSTATESTDVYIVFKSGSTPPPPPPPTACPPLKFFGVRGSGETAGDHDGFGRTISSMKDRLAAKVPGLSAEALDYPAIPVDMVHPTYPANYVDSVWDGKNRLLDHVGKFISACPTSYVVLAGYSQGAEVVQTAYLEMADSTKKHVASVDFFGNPLFNPKQPSINIGNFNPKLAGIFFIDEKITSKWAPRVSSYCIAGDPVCNFSDTNAAFGWFWHLRYPDNGWTAKAADSAVLQWKRLPKLK
jgi:hypothetical protein